MQKIACHFCTLKYPPEILEDNPDKYNSICYFDRSSEQQNNWLKIQHLNSSCYQVPILSKVKNIFPLPEGILLEIQNEEFITREQLNQNVKSENFQQELENSFSYFSLQFHPLCDFRPVVLDQKKRLFKQEIEIIHTEIDIPFGIAYDNYLKRHIFFLVETDFQEIIKMYEEIDFDKMIPTIEMKEESFEEKVYQQQNLINLKNIYEENQQMDKAQKIIICEKPFDLNNPSKKQYNIYLLNRNQNGHLQLDIYNLEINLQQDSKKRFFYNANVEKLKEMMNVNDIWGISYFQNQNSIFQTKNYFLDSFQFENENMFNFSTNGENINMNKHKFNKKLFQKQTKKSLKSLFKKKLKYDSIIIQQVKSEDQNKQLSLMIFDEVLFKIQIDYSLLNLQNENDFLKKFKVNRIENKKIIFSSLDSQQEFNFFIQHFQNELFNVVFQILKELVDIKTFIFIMQSLFINNIKICSEKYFCNYPYAVDNENELIISFFSFLLIQQGMTDAYKKFGSEIDAYKKINYVYDENFKNKQVQISKSNINEPFFENFLNIIINNSKAKIKIGKIQFKDRLFPKLSHRLPNFFEKKIQFFKFLHLLNEDLRILNTKNQLHQDLTYFLFIYSMFLNQNYTETYCFYYLKLNSKIFIKYKESGIIQKMIEVCKKENYFKFEFKGPQFQTNQISLYSEVLEKEIFDIYKFIHQLIQFDKEAFSKVQNYHFLFKNMYKIIKVICLLFKKKFKSKYYNSPDIQSENQNDKKLLLLHKNFLTLQCINKFKAKKQEKFLYTLKQEKENKSELLKILKFFIKHDITQNYIEQLNTPFELIYRNIFKLSRNSIRKLIQTQFLPKKAYKIMNREDLLFNRLIQPQFFSSKQNKLNRMTENAKFYNSNQSSYFIKNENRFSVHQIPLQSLGVDTEKEQMFLQKDFELEREEVQLGKNLHYSKNDIIFQEIYKLFVPTDYIWMNSNTAHEIMDKQQNDQERRKRIQELMNPQVQQKLASFVGKGALEFNSEDTAQTIEIQIPEINLKGKIKDLQTQIPYQFGEGQEEDKEKLDQMLIWPKFHIGVAIGLGISQYEILQMDQESLRSWIEYQGKDQRTSDQAGFFFGLGIQGNFNCFTVSDIYCNFRSGMDTRIIATILGLAVSKIPRENIQMDDTILKSFNVHLEYNYQNPNQITFSRYVQSAAILGIGIYLRGLSKKSESETMLNKIEAPIINDNNQGRECFSLSAGFALGLINLGKGKQAVTLTPITLDERLFQFIEGGNYNNEDKLKEYKSCNFKGISEIETQLTAPGALIALMLIHMKSNNKFIIDRLKLPNNIYDINNCNPTQIILKVLAKNMINWDAMNISNEFIQKSIPSIVKFIQKKNHKEIDEKFSYDYNYQNLDFNNVSIIYHNTIAGTLLSLSLKFCGTGNQQLKQCIIEYIKEMEKISLLESTFEISFIAKEKLDEYTYFNIISILSLSLGILMVGRCDTESFQLLKKIKNLLLKKKKLNGIYGFNMAVQMAIGFLFLGNGAWTFGNNNYQLACLILSVYPIFPSQPNDNIYHLQAFRHFYVLAIEKNLFHIVDIDTNKPLQMKVKLNYLDMNGQKIKENKITPLFYRTTDIWQQIILDNDEYYHLEYNFQSNNSRPFLLFVKKKYQGQININKLKSVILDSSQNSFDYKIQDIFNEGFLYQTFLDIKNQIPLDFSIHEKNTIMKYYYDCIYVLIKKDMISFLDIIMPYLMNKYQYHIGQVSIDQNYFIQNSKLIILFLQQMNRIDKSPLKNMSLFQWDIQKEIILLEKKIQQQKIKVNTLCNKKVQEFISYNFKEILLDQNDVEFQDFAKFEQILWFLKENEIEQDDRFINSKNVSKCKLIENKANLIQNIIYKDQVENNEISKFFLS